jgi:hypothetical protein
MTSTVGTMKANQYEYREQSILAKEEAKYSSILPGMMTQAYHLADGHQFTQYRYVTVAPETRQAVKVTTGEIFLFAVAAACVVVGVVMSIWPIALAGLGPGLLGLVDMSERRSRGKGAK